MGTGDGVNAPGRLGVKESRLPHEVREASGLCGRHGAGHKAIRSSPSKTGRLLWLSVLLRQGMRHVEGGTYRRSMGALKTRCGHRLMLQARRSFRAMQKVRQPTP